MSNSGRKPVLLVITSTFPRWENDHEPPFVYELSRRLTRQFDVTVLAPHAPGAKSHESMDGVRVHRFRYAPEAMECLAYDGGIPSKLRKKPWLLLLVPLFLLAQFSSTCGLLYRLKPRAIHAHWLITGGLVAAAALRVTRAPGRLLVTAHGADVYSLQHPLLLRLKRWVIRRADVVTVVSKALAERIATLGASSERVVVQAMGTDLQYLFVPQLLTATQPTIIYAGRLVAKKGVDTLLHAVEQLLPVIPELRVLIAGHGPEQHALLKLCGELNIRQAVTFSGPYNLHDLPQLYAQASVAVFPFRTAEGGDQDGLGLALVEAIGCKIPVVCSDLPALDDLLQHEVTGLRAPVDDPEALARCIQVCLNNPTAAAARADAAHHQVLPRYDWQRVAMSYAELLSAPVSAGFVTRNPADNSNLPPGE